MTSHDHEVAIGLITARAAELVRPVGTTPEEVAANIKAAFEPEPVWVQPPTGGDGTPGVEPEPEALSVEGRLLLAEARAEMLEKEIKQVRAHMFSVGGYIKPEPPPDRSWVTTEPAPRRKHFWWAVLGLVMSVAAIACFLVVAWNTPGTTDYRVIVPSIAMLLAGIAGLVGFPGWLDD